MLYANSNSKMNKYKNNTFYLSAVLLLFAFIFLFAQIYLADKTIIPTQISDSMYKHNSLVGVNIICGDKGLSYTTWAEEPPLYHMVGIILIAVFNSFIFLKILPFVLFSLFILGVKFSYQELFQEQLEFKYTFLLYFIPFIYIHLARALPDTLAITLLIWFFYFWIKGNLRPAFIFAALAVTTKVLAIFPIFFLMGHYLIFERKFNFKKRFFIALTFALTILPTLLWFYYLYLHKINNPFFENHFAGFHHLNSRSQEILYFKRKFWSKILTWVIIRGISIPLFVLIIWGLIKQKIKQTSLLLFMFIGHLCYIIFTNPMQVSSPWYSFYFLFIYMLFSFNLLIHLPGKIKVFVIACYLVHAFFMIDYSLNIQKNTDFQFITSLSSIPCDFHEYYRHAKNIILK
jgi:hypothetical protein